ncbi:hypothetical protein ASE11_23990 [Hydrogenophaga sp. Root209]|uniref:hypothetical protein n=1 Tax=unclassified Hydrogenophaga TaxID=2610897 RepID=UPI0006F32500|nr:hypothetical protein [Hydrogenophaga sp. Root209]KRC06120.1 hypothetical protein ASE11_23990 [Hydrogenophaga sp. Root209]
MKNILLCVIWLLVCAGASAQALWQGVPAGATSAEVQALMPGARVAPGDPLSKDESVRLEIPVHELAGARFKVSFVFKADQLQRITLLADAGSADEARALGQRLTTSLRARYGLEMSTRSRGATSSPTIDRQWSFRRTSVHLQVVDETFVRLDYSGQAPPRTNRL